MLQPLNYRNLDELPEFKGKNTTTEFVAKYVFDNSLPRRVRVTSAARAVSLAHSREIAESHVARASYEAPLW